MSNAVKREILKGNVVQEQKLVFSQKNRRYVVIGRVKYFSPVRSPVTAGTEVVIQYRPHPVTMETMSVILILQGGSRERWWALDDIQEMKANLSHLVPSTGDELKSA